MDRRTQQLNWILLSLVMLLSGLISNAQDSTSFVHPIPGCSDSVIVVPGECERVIMPFYMFTDLYVAKRNLGIIAKNNPSYKRQLDSLEKAHKDKDLVFQKELDATNEKVSLMDLSLSECNQTLVNVEVSNMQLRKRITILRRRNRRTIVIGMGVGAIGTLVLMNLIN